jgi:outer membrane protein
MVSRRVVSRAGCLRLAPLLSAFALCVPTLLAGPQLAHAQAAAPAAAPAAAKLAVVDVRRAVLETEEGLRVQSTLKKLVDQRAAEIDLRLQQVQKEKDAIDKDAANPKADKAALQKRAEAWAKSYSDLQALQGTYQNEMRSKEKALTDPILAKVQGLLKRIASTDGLDLIVDIAAAPYFRSDLDLTDRVIQLYNASDDTKPAAKPEPKPEPKPAPKPEAKPAPKPEAKPAPKPKGK